MRKGQKNGGRLHPKIKLLGSSVPCKPIIIIQINKKFNVKHKMLLFLTPWTMYITFRYKNLAIMPIKLIRCEYIYAA